MRKLNIPTCDACLSLKTCISSVRNKDLRDRLTSAKPDVIAAEAIYKNRGASGTLYTIAATKTVAGCVTVEEMEKLYERTFSRKTSQARLIYDVLKTASGICPLCAQGKVDTLDHYLAKSLHPALAVTPANLVPACFHCNKAKHDKQPSNAEDQTLHPYFDDVDDGEWLSARIIEDSPPVVQFFADPPADWSEVIRERVKTHFRVFNLAELYTTYAASELLNIHLDLTRIADRGGPDDLKRHLVEQKESREAVARNSWQGAMYKALSESEWFCARGYKFIRT